jgi:hypothetical protein
MNSDRGHSGGGSTSGREGGHPAPVSRCHPGTAGPPRRFNRRLSSERRAQEEGSERTVTLPRYTLSRRGGFPHGAIGRLSSLRQGVLGHGQHRPRRESARLLVANGAGMAALSTEARRQEATRSRGQVRAFRIGLPGELLPSLRHFLQDPALLLGLCLLRQTAAFLREALIFG